MTDSTRQILVADRVLTLDPSQPRYAPGAVLIEAGRIVAVGAPEQMPPAAVQHLPEQILMPGLVNTHTHTPMYLYRGLTEDIPRGKWLTETMRPLEHQMSVDDLRAGALAGSLELLLNGVTTTADRYGDMDQLADVIESTGVRAIVAHSLYDSEADDGLMRTAALLERYGTDPAKSRITVAIGPHATDTCGPDVLRRVRQLADRTAARVMIHVAQSQEEVAFVAARDHASCGEYLDNLGLLGPEVIAAHCTYLSDSDVDRLGRSRASIAHCPSSNAKLEGRLAPISRLCRNGATVGLGTDAACCNNTMDLFREMQIAGLLHKVAADDPTAFDAEELLRMATIDAARVLGLDHLIGSLTPGKCADLIALDTNAAHLHPWHADTASLLHAARGSDVTAVWVDGEQVVRDRRPTRFDVREVVRSAAHAAGRLRLAHV
ncbi:MAG: amidohydrolase family protein [Chloroflexota bacterium]